MKFFLFLSVFISFQLNAIVVEFVGPCESTPFHIKEVEQQGHFSVGELTIKVLQESKIPFSGGDYGIIQISNSPIGEAALEIVNNQEMMAYGWCYEVDGFLQEVYPNEISAAGIKKIRWFYGYAHYRSGEWIAQCLESHKKRSPFICK